MMPATAPPPGAKLPPSLRSLVADDSDMLRASIRGLLQRLGHSVAVVSNGREAVETNREAFDYLLLDIQMREMDGFETARAVRKLDGQERLPQIIGVSGERESRQTYVAAGMDSFLLKPVRLNDLVVALQP